MPGFNFEVDQVTEVNDASIQDFLVDFVYKCLKDRRSIFEHILHHYDCIRTAVNYVRPKITIILFLKKKPAAAGDIDQSRV